METPRLLVSTGGTRPIGTVASTSERQITPPSQVAVSPTASISWMRCIAEVSTNTPPIVVAWPLCV
jgi:hypothetical protein